MQLRQLSTQMPVHSPKTQEHQLITKRCLECDVGSGQTACGCSLETDDYLVEREAAEPYEPEKLGSNFPGSIESPNSP